MSKMRLAVLGDGFIGKTALLIVFKDGRFPQDYLTTIFETYVHKFEVDGAKVDLTMLDTAGQEDYDRLRPLAYPDTDVFLYCFSVDNRDSFRNIGDRWFPEIKHYRSNTASVLVGTKADLRFDEETAQKLKSKNQTFVAGEEGSALAKELGAYGYYECSAKRGEGIQQVFVAAVRAVRSYKPSKRAVAVDMIVEGVTHLDSVDLVAYGDASML